MQRSEVERRHTEDWLTNVPQPLIMGGNVIKALNIATGERWEGSLQDYGRYLDLAADWAADLDVTADVIEWRLFQIAV